MPEIDQLGWSGSGPLPTSELEQGAWTLFMLDHAEWQWDAVTTAVRDDYRKRYLTIRARVLREERWGIDNAHDKLAEQLGLVIFGAERKLGATIRKELVDYAETFIADAWGHFSKRLFYPREIQANAAEVAAEAGRAN